MTELGPDAKALIEIVGDADGPSADDRQRVRRALFGTLAGGATLTGTTTAALGAPGGAGVFGAAAAKGGTITTQVLLWLVAGGVAGAAVATPVALYAGRSEPEAVTHIARTPPAPAPQVSEREAQPAHVATTEEAVVVERELEPAAKPQGKAVLRAVVPASTAPSEPLESAVPRAPSIGSEVELLKRAQRELAAGNASASLALLDAHAQRFATGALQAERLAARVFAHCELGQVEAAKAAARQFLGVAPDSPLVPRVATSCAGSGIGGQRQ